MFVKGSSSTFKARALILLAIGFITMYCTGMFGTDIINVIQNPIMEKLGCTATQAVLGWTIGGYPVLNGSSESGQVQYFEEDEF